MRNQLKTPASPAGRQNSKLKTSLASQSGQALILLLIIVTIGIITTSAAAAVTIINLQASAKFSQGQIAYAHAQSGAENAIIRLLRNPNYSGETINISSATITITVTTAGTTKTIVSKAQDANFIRKVQVVGQLLGNVLNITSWQEIN